MQFYDRLAELYDEMIDLDHHLHGDLDMYRRLLGRFPAKHILDAGCGTGLHSLIFAKLGSMVTGIDSSSEMIVRARQNASLHRLDIEFVKADFINFPDDLPGPYDAIFCMGNSYVHLPDASKRLQVLANFHQVLNPGGMLCLQILNYDKILKDKPAVISEKKRAPYHFIRRYGYLKQKIIFTLEIRGLPEPFLLEQDIFPVKSADLLSLASESGFNLIDLTGSLNLEPYDPELSPNICAWFRKGDELGIRD